MVLNICEAFSFHLQMAWQDKSSYVPSFNGNGILPCCGSFSHVASHVVSNPTDSTAVLQFLSCKCHLEMVGSVVLKMKSMLNSMERARS